MGTKKSFGIRIHSVIFPHVVFKRSVTIKSYEIDPQISTNATIDEENNILYVELHFIIQNEEKSLSIELVCMGQFQEDAEEPTIALKEFANKEAPAILFPYVREYVSSLTLKSGIAPIVLPPINFQNVSINNKSNKKQTKPSSSKKKSSKK